ncbi:MAG: hypothetical protein WDM96_06255 [Lacunisphaera sp.]
MSPPRKPTPKPWPMKWIVLAIVLFIAVYTTVEFFYRKKGPAYRPYQDAQDRATTARLLAAGWQKVQLETRRPIEKPALDGAAATISHELAGLGPDLESKFAEKPKLIATIDSVAAPASVVRGQDCTVYFTASLSRLKDQVGDLTLYRHDHELVLIPSIENLPGKDLMSRWNDSTYCVSFSTANLPPGRYTMRVVAMAPAATWTFDVR